MKHHLITIIFPGARADDLMHQIRNFGEDLERKLKRGTSVQNADTATDRIFVDVMSNGRLKGSLAIISGCLKSHFLDYRSSIEVSDGDER